jgi:hypothetical protein
LNFRCLALPWRWSPNRNQTRWSNPLDFRTLSSTLFNQSTLMNIEEDRWFFVWLCPHNDSLKNSLRRLTKLSLNYSQMQSHKL